MGGPRRRPPFATLRIRLQRPFAPAPSAASRPFRAGVVNQSWDVCSTTASTTSETDCDQAKGAAAAQTLLAANPDIKAIYSACGPPALGAIQSIKNAHLGGIILVAFDGLPDEVTAIKAGDETATVAQHPKLMGSMGPATLLKAIQGKKVAKNIDTGTELITG